MEDHLPSGVIKTISYSPSDSVITVQGRSPVEIRVRDSQGRMTGMVNGEMKEGIPNSLYHRDSKTVIIFSPTDEYSYEIVGTGDGGYELEINSANGEKVTTFTADVTTSFGAVHEYTIGWDVLSQGGDGVTVRIDDDGDGAFERSMVSDNRLTQDEYSPVTAVTSDGLYPSAWGDMKRTVLLQNYPNPFNPETWIPYQLAEDADVTVRIYNTSGQLIKMLDVGHKPAGIYADKNKAVHWDGRNSADELVANGVYFYTISADSFRSTKKMTIAK